MQLPLTETTRIPSVVITLAISISVITHGTTRIPFNIIIVMIIRIVNLSYIYLMPHPLYFSPLYLSIALTQLSDNVASI